MTDLSQEAPTREGNEDILDVCHQNYENNTNKIFMYMLLIFLIVELLLNATIEERVSLLEIQVVVVQEDVTELDEDVTGLEGHVNLLSEEQFIQDERILILEQDSDVFDDEIKSECI